ncbi:Bug family tripartite tricarboxylate transporter substrate binding protein [Falsiroseomonas oryzae]|uniref:Bug family tripartite tricarboxylate transporter substrate binding protein n=1 Tax=Falsiroseomonas oryzae TaxID=2766473 RepID=UPI0022EA2E36|nr:tripartite tricarboxylate transporter substrate-binding protein [Roseomonas sp. MO-31]
MSHPLVRAVARRQTLALGIGTGIAGAARRPAIAQAEWPARTVGYIEPYAPGGGTDTASRLWCTAMADLTGQTFVVENRTGGGGTIGNSAIARSAPDGYTIGLGGIGTHVIAPHVVPNLSYDPARDFTMIGGQWRQPVVLLVNNDIPAHSVAELLALLRRDPGRLQYATGGIGNTPHLAGELFRTRAGLELPHVPYRGPEVMVDLMAGRIPIAWGLFSTGMALAREGKVRALGVSSLERHSAAPDLPAIAETLPGFDLVSWACIVGPAGIPPAMVARISEYSARALRQPTLVQRYMQDGSTPWPATPAELSAYRAQQAELLAPVIRASGARAG